MSASDSKYRHGEETIAERTVRVRDIERAFSQVDHTPQKMLDVGFGNAAIIWYFHSKGISSTGIEVSERFVSDAKSRFPELNVLHYDGLTFPFEDDSFDTVILNDVLEHISYQDIESVLSEIKRVLVPNGVIFISVMNRWQLVEPHTLVPLLTWLPRFAWNSVCKKISGKNYINYWPYTRGKLESLLDRHNLNYTDITNIYVEHKLFGINPIGDRTTSRLVRLLKKLHLITIFYYLALKVSVLVYIARVK
ncbi:MAG: methyltransferase domain-containing protein [Candidatus Lokiarchaeota archaeon]|nr:methyltransferase domain-containing protein [Candidatus Lokiarchaeota archaeon]